eukprot:c24801_g1_i1 orf=522-1619(-)
MAGWQFGHCLLYTAVFFSLQLQISSATNNDIVHPRKPLDYLVGIVIALGCVPFILGNIILLVNRNYRPIKTRSVTLTVLSSVGGLIWVVATIVVNDHFGRRWGSVWTICSLWTFWLQACFGFSLWLNCLTMRLLTLYLIFVRKRKDFKYNFFILFLLLLPAIVFCICASAKHGSRFKSFHSSLPHQGDGDCKIQQIYWSYGLLILLLLYFLVFLGFSFKLRNTMAQFNEFRLICNGGVMTLFLFLLSLVTIQTDTYTLATGRCFLSFSVAVAVFYYFWARNGEVVYNVIFYKKEYEQKFHEELNRLPSEHERESFPDSFRNMETQLKEAREKIAQYHIRTKQLEDELGGMEEKYNQLQQRALLQA